MVLPRRLVIGLLLTNALQTIFTESKGVKVHIKRLVFTNTGSTAANLTVYLAPSATAATAQYCIRQLKVLAPGDAWICAEAENQIVEAGGTVQVTSDQAAIIAATMSGYEESIP